LSNSSWVEHSDSWACAQTPTPRLAVLPYKVRANRCDKYPRSKSRGDPVACDTRAIVVVRIDTKTDADNFLISNAHSGFRSQPGAGRNRRDSETKL
jgi:hypothetical protein